MLQDIRGGMAELRGEFIENKEAIMSRRGIHPAAMDDFASAFFDLDELVRADDEILVNKDSLARLRDAVKRLERVFLYLSRESSPFSNAMRRFRHGRTAASTS